jgi:hypothetical protein
MGITTSEPQRRPHDDDIISIALDVPDFNHTLKISNVNDLCLCLLVIMHYKLTCVSIAQSDILFLIRT